MIAVTLVVVVVATNVPTTPRRGCTRSQTTGTSLHSVRAIRMHLVRLIWEAIDVPMRGTMGDVIVAVVVVDDDDVDSLILSHRVRNTHEAEKTRDPMRSVQRDNLPNKTPWTTTVLARRPIEPWFELSCAEGKVERMIALAFVLLLFLDTAVVQ